MGRTPDENWRDDSIQFPRLIAELEAADAFTPAVMEALCASMDLPSHKIEELITRAQDAWERIVQETAPCPVPAQRATVDLTPDEAEAPYPILLQDDTIEKVAHLFSELLHKGLARHERLATLLKNRRERAERGLGQGMDYTDATHDYCDPNMLMLEAIADTLCLEASKVMGNLTDESFPPAVSPAPTPVFTNLWNAAWARAYENDFWWIEDINDLATTWPEGSFTPAGGVLCPAHYNATAASRHRIDSAKRHSIELDRDDEIIAQDWGYCLVCNERIALRADVALYSKLVIALRERDIPAYVAQTGGMCAALAVDAPWGEVMITWDEDCADQLCVGAYTDDGDFRDDVYLPPLKETNITGLVTVINRFRAYPTWEAVTAAVDRKPGTPITT